MFILSHHQFHSHSFWKLSTLYHHAFRKLHSLSCSRYARSKRLRRPRHRRYTFSFELPFNHHHHQAYFENYPGNAGIGYEITLQLALHGARVYIAGRSPDRVKKAIEQMKSSSTKPLDLHMIKMDLQSLRSVKEAAEYFMRQESRLDLLINNAGVSVLFNSAPTAIGKHQPH